MHVILNDTGRIVLKSQCHYNYRMTRCPFVYHPELLLWNSRPKMILIWLSRGMCALIIWKVQKSDLVRSSMGRNSFLTLFGWWCMRLRERWLVIFVCLSVGRARRVCAVLCCCMSYGGYERISAFNVKLWIKSPNQVVGTDLEHEVLHSILTL